MGRTAGQFCSRASMYPPQHEVRMSSPESLINDGEQPDMTWQQKRDFGPAVKANTRKSKRVHFTLVNVKAIKDLPVPSTTSNSEALSEREAIAPIVRAPQLPRDKAAASPLHRSTPAAANDPALATSSQNEASISQKPSRKSFHSHRSNKRSAMDKKLDAVPDRAYIPPHLRKKGTSAEANVAAIKDPGSITNGSSIASVKSTVGRPDKVQSSPNGASNDSHLRPSPPTTPQEPQGQDGVRLDVKDVEAALDDSKANSKQEDTKDSGQDYPGWDTPKPDPPPPAPRKEKPNFPGTRTPPQKQKWTKQSDIKPQPSLGSSDGGVTCRSSSDGDPNYDVKKLMDWNGDWLPPPEQWSARKGHTIRHFGQGIEQWINGHDDICLKAIDTNSANYFAEDSLCKEVVPNYWIMSKIEQRSLGEFWKLMPTRQPSALSEVSIHPPFWERYEEGSNLFIDALPMHDARIDPSDPDNHFAGADLLASADVRTKRYFGHKRRKEEKATAKQKLPVRDSVPMIPPPPDRRIKPKSNVYFRPVQPADVRGIAQIYNHYVDTTIFANEFEARSENQIGARIDAIIKAGLPYLVAIARGNQPRGPQGYVSERIVGYAALDDYCDQSSIYRYTFELELYVHPGYLSQNIASCLLDRLLEMANTSYNARGGYDYRNDSNYLKTGPSRVIKTIMLTIHKERGDDDKGLDESKAKTDAYMKRFKFVCCGHIPNMGFKLGKVVDVYLYRHETNETIDPHSRPTVAS